MVAASVARFVAALRSQQLLDDGQLRSLGDDALSPFPSADAFGQELIRRGWLTAYQVDEIGRGRERDLVVDAYVLLSPLGQGGMGQVFLARHRQLDRKVALKLIRPDRLADHPERLRQYLDRFQREGRAAAKLDHPNIVPVYDAGEANGRPFFAMKFIEGTDLGAFVQWSDPLPAHTACQYAREVALGLQHAHEHGLVHRDIKPSNLLLCMQTGQVKIMDLGLVRLPDDGEGTTREATRPGMMLGTPDYMAPEQSADPHGADIRADLYSVGCTLFYLLTRQVPFPDGDLAHKAYCHRHEKPPSVRSLRPGVPAGVDAIVQRLLAKMPEDRYQTPAELTLALEPWSRPSAPGSDTLTVPPPARRRSVRKWLLIPLVAFPVVVLAAVAPWLLPAGTRPDPTGGGPEPTTPRVEPTTPRTDPSTRPAKDPRVVKQLREYKDLAGHVRFVGFSNDSKYAIYSGGGGVLLVSDPARETPKLRLGFGAETVGDVSWDGDVGRALLWRSIKHELRLVSLPGKQELAKFSSADGGSVRWAALAPDGKHAVSIDDKGTVRLWDCGAGGELGTLDGHKGPVDAALFSRDGQRVLTGGQDSTDRIWDVAQRRESVRLEPKPIHRGWMSAVALSPDEKHVAAGGMRSILVWDVATKQQIHALPGHSPRTSALVFTPDGKRVLSGGWDGMLRLWDLEGEKELARFEGHTQLILSVAVSPDGKYALSGGADGTARLWEMPN